MSIYSIFLDSCYRLWLLDTGVWDGRSCGKPTIYIYDIRPNGDEDVGKKLFASFTIQSSMYYNAKGFQNIIVDVNKKKCHKAIAYVANTFDNTLLVYEMAEETIHVYKDPSFRSEPSETRVTVGGVAIKLKSGLRALAIGPIVSESSRKVLYSADGR